MKGNKAFIPSQAFYLEPHPRGVDHGVYIFDFQHGRFLFPGKDHPYIIYCLYKRLRRLPLA